MAEQAPFKIVKADETPSSSSQLPPIDWSQCFICQLDICNKLTCPAKFSERFRASSYETLARNLSKFDELGLLPPSLKPCHLTEGDNLEETLKQKQASFHKSCSLRYNDTELQRSLKRRKTVSGSDASDQEKFTRQKVPRIDSKQVCLFCEKSATKSQRLHEATRLDFDRRVRECAMNLQDDKLLAKLSAGDLISIEAKYHEPCLRSFYNRDRSHTSTCDNLESSNPSNTAFAELISYVQTQLDDETLNPVFQLSELKKLYSSRVKQLQNKIPTGIHSTRFKNKILSYFPQLQAHQEGRDVLLVCDKSVGSSLKRACEADRDDQSVILSKAANIVRREILSTKCTPFDGSFKDGCQTRSVPHSLLSLVTMVLYGTNIKEDAHYSSQASLSLSQLMLYNCVQHRKSNSETRHNEDRETPLPLFLGAVVHSKTRSKDLVDILFKLGLSVSYDRVLGLSADLGNAAINHFENVGAVCPPSLKIGVFTTSAVDNIDHNPTSTTAKTSFHGTGISLFQHPDGQDSGREQIRPAFHRSGRKVSHLPDSYAVVPVVPAVNKEEPIPEMPGLVQLAGTLTKEALAEEKGWCKHVYETLKEPSQDEMHVSWAAYHANKIQPTRESNDDSATAVTALLPLFQEDSKSTAMIKHSMDVVKQAVTILNPGQVPVIACDQPLFKLAKTIQWTWPDTHGESSYVVMLGGLHIKMTLLKALAELLEGSGWTSAIVQADIATVGTAESFLKVSHVKKTARAHQITACALYCLQQQAYLDYKESQGESEIQSLEDWVADQRSPQFRFWQLVLEVELGLLTWDRAIHMGDFPLYLDALTELQWLFHSLDHHHYARAVGIHLRDMVTLAARHPNIHAEFCKGHFAVNKTSRPFSKMSLDECHEQNNALIKEDGGAVGLTEKPTSLLRWMVCGPEMARIVGEFIDITNKTDIPAHLNHHEDKPGTQKTFLKHTESLIAAMTEMGNPFKDQGGDLLVLDTRVVLQESVVESIKGIVTLGREQAKQFFDERLVNRTKLISDTISKNKLHLFAHQPQKSKSRSQKELSSIKQDRSLFSSLYISCQVRDTDLTDFFQHENQTYPPSLSVFGDMRYGTKSDLLHCIEDLVPHHDTASSQRNADMVILDGAAIVHMIKPGTCRTFDDYVAQIMEYIRRQFQGSVRRVDMVFDVYIPDSLKSSLREKRGSGTRIRIEGCKKLPSNWPEFLRESENKTALFYMIGSQVEKELFPGLVIITQGEKVLCSQTTNVDNLSPCSQEEADTRMLLHALDGATQGYDKVFIRTVDTDVVVLFVSMANQIDCESIWIAFGTGKSFRYIDATAIAEKLGEEKCKALGVFHALTGCDITSSFAGKGKRTAWAAWQAFDDVTTSLVALSRNPTADVVTRVLPTIERFIVIMYDRGSSENKVNEARQVLFSQKRREIENLPPTQDALIQHLLRVCYQAGYVWGQCLIKQPTLPDPGDFGWTRDTPSDPWKVRWMTIPPAGEACRSVIKCGCIKGCRGQCRCIKAELPCTQLCKCGGCKQN